MKWLTDLTVQEEEAKGYYMETAYRYPVQPIEPGIVIKPSVRHRRHMAFRGRYGEASDRKQKNARWLRRR
ncbi:MAG: hypothetical protein NW703_09845 [Nitrospiraceae bacterium]